MVRVLEGKDTAYRFVRIWLGNVYNGGILVYCMYTEYIECLQITEMKLRGGMLERISNQNADVR